MSDGWMERPKTASEDLGRMDEAVRDLTQQLTAVTQRAERAERERDSALVAAGEAEGWRIRAERAEADNAALLAELESIHNDDPYVVSADALANYKQHPGAALLERMRALEIVADVATEALGALVLGVGPACDQARDGARDRLAAALRAHDALKVPRE